MHYKLAKAYFIAATHELARYELSSLDSKRVFNFAEKSIDHFVIFLRSLKLALQSRSIRSQKIVSPRADSSERLSNSRRE